MPSGSKNLGIQTRKRSPSPYNLRRSPIRPVLVTSPTPEATISPEKSSCGCSCNGKCSSKICGCMKKKNKCGPLCKCNKNICKNQHERELADYRERELDTSSYYKETIGITPEVALKNVEKLQQMEELVASLKAEVKQKTLSQEEDRSWAQELECIIENERDQFREQLEKQDNDKVRIIEERDELRDKVKKLNDQLVEKDLIVQQYQKDLAERDRL